MDAVRAAKRIVKRSLMRSGIPQALTRISPPSAVILRFHSIQEDPREFDSTIGTEIMHSAKTFAAQMALIARRFHVITLDDLVESVDSHRRVPRRSVIITFDDGYRDNYEIAAPILVRYGLRAAFYITVASIGNGAQPPWFCRLRHAFRFGKVSHWHNPYDGKMMSLCDEDRRDTAFMAACEQCASLTGDCQHEFVRAIEGALNAPPFLHPEQLMMKWEQIRTLHEAGHIIGSHTLTHPNLAHTSPHDLLHELRTSKRILERELNAPVVHFSYPSPILQPHWTKTTVAATHDAGYRTAVTCTEGPFMPGHDLLVLPRIVVPTDLDDFYWRLEVSLTRRRTFATLGD